MPPIKHLSNIQHILTRPEIHIGSAVFNYKNVWVYDGIIKQSAIGKP